MVSSLKDALLGAGLKAPEPPPKPAPSAPRRPHIANRDNRDNRGAPNKPRSADAQRQHNKPARRPALGPDSEPSLADAYKARNAQEQRERDLAKRKKELEAKAKRERLAAVDALLAGQSRNDSAAEEPRYFEYSRKIRRVYVTAEQQSAITSGELGIVQSKGTYLLVDASVARAVAAAAPEFLALLLEPEAAVDQSSADPAA